MYSFINAWLLPKLHILVMLATAALVEKRQTGWKEFVSHFNSLNTFLLNMYVGHLESKERLRIQPAQLFHFS